MSALAHVHQLHCSFRRHQTWSIAAVLLSRTYFTRSASPHMSLTERTRIKKRRRALIFAVNERRVDRNAREEFTNTLHDILKHRRLHGLVDRGDTYVSVRELLNYQHFRMLNFANLQKMVNEDRWHRFELLYEPLKGGDFDSWWIRVREDSEKDVRIDPLGSGGQIEAAIYSTTLQNWRSYISLKGISRRDKDHIQISLGVPIQSFFTSSAKLSEQILIHIDLQQAIEMGIRFYIASKPSPASVFFIPSPSFSSGADFQHTHTDFHSFATDSEPPLSPASRIQPRSPPPPSITPKNRLSWILTPGNESGFLPPECFSKVEVVRVKRKVLWTLDEGVVEQESNDENEEEAILDSDLESTDDVELYTARSEGYETKHVEPSKKGMDQFFIDLPTDDQTRVVHSDLKKEALAILSA